MSEPLYFPQSRMAKWTDWQNLFPFCTGPAHTRGCAQECCILRQSLSLLGEKWQSSLITTFIIFSIIVQLQTCIIVHIVLYFIMKALTGWEVGFQGQGYNGACCSGQVGSIALLTTTCCDHGQDTYPTIPPFVTTRQVLWQPKAVKCSIIL